MGISSLYIDDLEPFEYGIDTEIESSTLACYI